MRGHGEILMGKNTMMKKAISQCAGQNPNVEKLIPLIKKNVGFVLTNGDLKGHGNILWKHNCLEIRKNIIS